AAVDAALGGGPRRSRLGRRPAGAARPCHIGGGSRGDLVAGLVRVRPRRRARTVAAARPDRRGRAVDGRRARTRARRGPAAARADRRRRRREPGDDAAGGGRRGGPDRTGGAHAARHRLGRRARRGPRGGLCAHARARGRAAAPALPPQPPRAQRRRGAVAAGHVARRPHRPTHRQRYRRRRCARPRRAARAHAQPPSGDAGPRCPDAVRSLGTFPRSARARAGESAMSTDPGQSPEPRDVDAEFARMLEGEGLPLRPGRAPREPAAPERSAPQRGADGGGEGGETLGSVSADSPPDPPRAESVARARAAHPAAGGRGTPRGSRGGDVPRELDDDEVVYGDFEEPDPDLPTPSDAAMWSWTALIGGFVLMLVVAVVPSLPGPLGWLGALATLGGLIALLLRAPRGRRDEGDDGAEV